MPPSSNTQARLACLCGFAFSVLLMSCGPKYAASRAAESGDGEASGGSGDTGGMGGSGGMEKLDAATGGSGGSVPRDSAVDPPVRLPDVAIDLAPPPPDMAADKAPESGPEGGQGKTVLLVMGYVTPK